MAKSSKGQKPPEFLSTHPSDERRIEQIKQWLPEALKYYRGG
jgi:Zn-dependent protease with chaperone function